MFQIDKKHGFAWFWKFLITYENAWDGKHFSLSFYPDYESPKFWFKFTFGKVK